ncbi:hypothetical protein ACS0TY_007002 [Phlomoides rotata]
MAAYAAVVSLMNTIDSIHNHPLHYSSLEKKQIQSLQKIIGSLLDFIESNNCHGGSKEEENLESRIASAARTAEDVIESHVVDQILGETSSTSLLDLERVLKDMNSVKEEVMQFKEFKDQQPPSYSMSAASSKPLSTTKNVMVGFDDELELLMDRLTGQQPNLQIIPIVGMSGIGKTTLTQNVYENLLIVEHFHIRACVTISQEYSVKNIFYELLSCIKNREINKSLGAFDCEIDQETEDQLGEKLYKSLWGRRYLLVLDDIWSIDVWDKIKFFFPDNDYRSRVLITTRISNVAAQFSSSPFEMNFLDEDKSWKLFCKKTCLEESCPPELEEIGKKITRNCKGLPLSISVIGGLLRSSRTQEYWERVARDTNSIVMLGNDEHCLKILFLSYNHLPGHLKPCFLYMGLFPEDHKIHLSRLIKLLVAEGFLKTSKVESLEEVAHDYLKDLVGRNLILVSRRRWNGRIQYCKMHDLVREVCLRIAEKEKFFYVMRVLETPPGICKERRIVFYSDTAMKEDQPQVYRFSSRANRFKSNENPLQIKAGRVLPSVNFESLEAIFQQVNLRYLAYEPSKSLSPEYLPSKLHSSVSLLWNMQTLVIRGATKRIDAPSEIWSMRQLRHLQFNEIFLPEPPPSDKQDHLLPNLQTLSKVVNFSFTEEACKRIPNIKKLRMEYDGECQLKCHYYLNNLASFHKLQSLNCSFDQVPKRGDLLHSLVFPSWLKKLCLRNCLLHWEDVNTFGLSLPHLEVLKLADRAVVGPEWHAVEGAFPRLKYLKISCQDLLKWTAEDSDFPVLEKLHLQYLFSLEKIPSGFGEIHTLGYLYVQWCSVSAAISSTEILEEQLSLGNDDLQVAVTLMMKHEEDRFKEMAEIESFTTKNFHYDVSFTSESFKPIGKPPFQYVATVLNKKI